MFSKRWKLNFKIFRKGIAGLKDIMVYQNEI